MTFADRLPPRSALGSPAGVTDEILRANERVRESVVTVVRTRDDSLLKMLQR